MDFNIILIPAFLIAIGVFAYWMKQSSARADEPGE